MEYYILISLDKFKGSYEFYNRCCCHLFNQIESSADVRVHVISESLADCDDWITDQSAVLDRLQNNFGASSEYISFKLHTLADSLIEKDVRILKLFWLFDNNMTLVLDDTIHLYGALLRLRNWHGATLCLIDNDYNENSDLTSYNWQEWMTRLSMDYGGSNHLSNINSIVVNLHDNTISHFQLLQLHEDCHIEGILSGICFFKGIFNINTIPKQLFSKEYFKLNFSDSNLKCLEELKSNSNHAAIFEMPFSRVAIECLSDKRYTRNNAKNGLNWRKYFIDDTVNNHNQVLQMKSSYKNSHFFLVTFMKTQNQLMAVRLLQEDQLRDFYASVLRQQLLTSGVKGSSDDRSEADLVDLGEEEEDEHGGGLVDIPVIENMDEQLERCMNKAHKCILQYLTDDNGSLTISEQQYKDILKDLELHYIHEISTKSTHEDVNCKENVFPPIMQNIEKDAIDIEDTIAWKRLCNRNENKRKKAIELSPPNKNEITITPAELARIFRKNSSDMAPLKRNCDSKVYCDVDRNQDQLKKYPLDMNDTKCHDIYYEDRIENFLAEKNYNELVKRLRSIETDCTIGSDPQNPQTLILSNNSDPSPPPAIRPTGSSDLALHVLQSSASATFNSSTCGTTSSRGGRDSSSCSSSSTSTAALRRSHAPLAVSTRMAGLRRSSTSSSHQNQNQQHQRTSSSSMEVTSSNYSRGTSSTSSSSSSSTNATTASREPQVCSQTIGRRDYSRTSSRSSPADTSRLTRSRDVRSNSSSVDLSLNSKNNRYSSDFNDSSQNLARPPRSVSTSNTASNTPLSTPASSTSTLSESEKRKTKSDKHKLILQDVVTSLLREKKLTSRHSIFNKCAGRLYKLTKSYIQDIKTTSNIRDDMMIIARSHVKTVIEFEKKHK